MAADILPWPVSAPFRAPCSYCERPMVRSMPSNDPAFCCYACGALGQPKSVKETVGSPRHVTTGA